MPEDKEEQESEEKKPKIILTQKDWIMLASVFLYTLNRWLKSLVACIAWLYNFGIFIALVALISVTEGKTRCATSAVNMVAYVTGMKFVWCTFEQTKLWLVLFGQIWPNAFACIDLFILLAEGGLSIYVFIIIATKTKDCENGIAELWAAMIICLINAIIMVSKVVIHTVCFIAYAVLLFTKNIQFEHWGEALSILGFLFKKKEKYEKAEGNESDMDVKKHQAVEQQKPVRG